jgi:hypothetical protein
LLSANGQGSAGPPKDEPKVFAVIDMLRGLKEGPPCYAAPGGCQRATGLTDETSHSIDPANASAPQYELVRVGTVRVFRQKFTLEDAIGSHACSLQANMRVTNGIPLGSPLL